jgi:hypothetical protein
MFFRILAGDGELIIIGDAVRFPAVVSSHPEWRLRFDGIDACITRP